MSIAMTGRCFSKILVFLLIQYSKGQTNSCGKSLKAVKDCLLILSDDLVDANTAQEKCSLLGGNLAMTDDSQINTTLTQLITKKYTIDLQRVYVFYDPITHERCRYSYNATEVDFWKSTKQLGHLWYFDLYKSNPENTSQPIFFCDAWTGRPNYKWGVNIGTNCQFGSNGWTLYFTLFSQNNTTKGQKNIFNYWGEYPSNAVGSNKLRHVNKSYGDFTEYKGSFLAPSINIFVGARYNTSLHGWYWNDGSPANFPVFNVTTCQQEALHYGIGWEQSSMKCSGEPAYYACQVKLRAMAKTFECNASTVVVTWAGVDQIINSRYLGARVEVHVLELNQRTYAPYTDLSTTIGKLSFATDYNFKITTMLTGCLNTNVSTSLLVKTYGNPPSSCYPPVNATAATFPCNASMVVVSWTGLDQFINSNDLTAQVEIRAQSLIQAISVPYSNNSVKMANLQHSTFYNIKVIVFITGSITTNITSDLTVTTPGNPPQSCFPKVNTTAETFPCNASIVVVSWTGLDQFTNDNGLTAQVKIHVQSFNQTYFVPYSDNSTAIKNLLQSTLYDIRVAVMITGSITTNITSNLTVTTPGNPPESCFPKVNTTVETFPCNASIVVVSWTGLDQFINDNGLSAQVKIYVQGLEKIYSIPYSDNSTTIENLLQSTLYDIQVAVMVTGSITTNITSNPTVTTPGNPPQSCFSEANTNTTSSGIIAGLVIGVLLLVLVIVGMVVMFKRRRDGLSKGQSLQAEVSNHQTSRLSSSDQVATSAYVNFSSGVGAHTNSKVINLYKKNAESGLLFGNEFKDIVNQCKNHQNTRDVSQLPENAVRNRYKNIYPYDHARVVLQGTGGNDYINAAYIPGYDNERKFIATQGPKKETINDFWWMVWQENSNIIVMLTGLRENGKVKCEKYWPDVGSENKLSPGLKVQTQQEITIGGIVQRQLVLSKTTDQRTITQLQYTTWPDHGIPVTTSNMIYLRNMVDDLHHTNAPIIVHCSAGVGRSGTFIAMDTLFHELDDKGTVDVPRTALRMRENRIDMIQNPKQYMYVYKLLMEHESLMETDKDVTELQSMTASEINKMQEKEFETLSAWRFGEEWQENHPQLRTYKNTSVKVWDKKSETIQQLDASYIQEHGSSEFFIAARNPAPGENENFWKTVVDQRVSLVVDLDHSIQVAIDAALECGDISLSVHDVNESKIHSVLTVNVLSSTNAFAERQLILLQVKGWSDVERPPEEMDFVTLIAAMQRLKVQQKCQCVLVGCSNGSNRTGTFIGLVNILERLKAQKRVDVFRTVKDLRDMRPNMVNNKELYKYCYSVVMKYLSDFDTYSNYK